MPFQSRLRRLHPTHNAANTVFVLHPTGHSGHPTPPHPYNKARPQSIDEAKLSRQNERTNGGWRSTSKVALWIVDVDGLLEVQFEIRLKLETVGGRRCGGDFVVTSVAAGRRPSVRQSHSNVFPRVLSYYSSQLRSRCVCAPVLVPLLCLHVFLSIDVVPHRRWHAWSMVMAMSTRKETVAKAL